jgi:hypothetical protein
MMLFCHKVLGLLIGIDLEDDVGKDDRSHVIAAGSQLVLRPATHFYLWFFISFTEYADLHKFFILASNSRRYSYLKNHSPLSPIRGVGDSAYR